MHLIGFGMYALTLTFSNPILCSFGAFDIPNGKIMSGVVII